MQTTVSDLLHILSFVCVSEARTMRKYLQMITGVSFATVKRFCPIGGQWNIVSLETFSILS